MDDGDDSARGQGRAGSEVSSVTGDAGGRYGGSGLNVDSTIVPCGDNIASKRGR